MPDALYYGTAALAFAGGTLLVLAWLVGVQRMHALITDYRNHPERYPDADGLGRWMAWTLAGGGSSFLLCAAAVAAGSIDAIALGPWAGATGVLVAVLALAGHARYRTRAPAEPPPGRRTRPQVPRTVRR